MKSLVTWSLAVILAIFVGTTLTAADPKDDPAKKELEKMQGTWMYESVEMDGKAMPADELKKMRITFAGDKFTVKSGDKAAEAGTQKLDPTKKPKTVDATVTEGEGKGTTMLGIYELEGDTLKACFDPTGKKRPTEFKAPAGSGLFTAVLKREKK